MIVNGCELLYSSIDKSKHTKVYRTSQKHCKNCSHKNKCIGGSAKCRKLLIPFFNKEADIQRSNCGTKRYFEVQRKRRVYCEGNFALQKDNHNLRRTGKRGNEKVMEHCLCSALALNLKRLVRHLKSKEYQNKLHKFLYYFIIFYRKLKKDLIFINSFFFLPNLSTRP